MSERYRCGPSWFPEWLRRIGSARFNASCRIHDMDYAAPHKFTKEEADARFLEHMTKQAEGSLFWSAMAYVYYFLARTFGGPSWEKDDATPSN